MAGRPIITNLGQIRNFAWIDSCCLARGEQPRREDYRRLCSEGFGSVLSLREKYAPKEPGWDAYDARNEAKICAEEGLSFRHIPCIDKFLPQPLTITTALLAIDEELAAGRAVFVHCLYGVGRTGLISGAWVMGRCGVGLREAGEQFFQFFDQMYVRDGIAPETYEAHHREYRVLQYWWAIRIIAAAMDLDTNVPDPYPSDPPPNAYDWEMACRKAFVEWKSGRRRSLLIENDVARHIV